MAAGPAVYLLYCMMETTATGSSGCGVRSCPTQWQVHAILGETIPRRLIVSAYEKRFVVFFSNRSQPSNMPQVGIVTPVHTFVHVMAMSSRRLRTSRPARDGQARG